MFRKGEDMAKKKSTLGKTLKKETKKQAKKNPLVAVLLLALLAVGAVGGFFGIKVLTKNDTFQLVGQQEVELAIGQDYVEEGVKIVSFGKDVSEKVKTETNLNTEEAGQYYVKYTVDDFRFKNVVRYRYITVVEVNP